MHQTMPFQIKQVAQLLLRQFALQTLSMIAVDQLTVTVTVSINMIYANFISLIELSVRKILYPVMVYYQLINTLDCFKSRLDE